MSGKEQDPKVVLSGILCNCGSTHTTFEAWQKCPMALIPRAVDPCWWRHYETNQDLPLDKGIQLELPLGEPTQNSCAKK